MSGHTGRERGAGNRAEAVRVDGDEAVGARAHELSGLCGGDGGVPGGGRVPVLLGGIGDTGEQRGFRGDFARLSDRGREDVEGGESRGGVSLHQRERNAGGEPYFLVEGERTNRERIDGVGGGGLLEARVYRCGAVGQLVEAVCVAAASAAIVEAVPIALRGRGRLGTGDVGGNEREFAAASD
ncbi:MAG TPA: hypothetical protein VN843_32060 [Anaerolineales bacterium]|nr:hypothetical protein [Anaerolineales bacterium]